MSHQDQRKYHRVTPARENPVRVDINGSNFIDVVYAQDISEGGLRLVIKHGFEGCEIDKVVDLLIKLPKPIAKSVKATGKIRHLTGQTFGISITSITKPDQRMLANYIASHTQSAQLWNRVKKLFGTGAVKSNP